VESRESNEKLGGGEIDLRAGSGLLRWLDNFWYHHKWKVIIITFFAIFFIVGIVQMAGKTESDISVTVATHTIYYKENVDALERDLESLMPRDRNGDGKKDANLRTFKIYSEDEMKAANEAETDEDGNPVIYADEAFNKEQIKQFNSYLGLGECTVMILSEYMYDDVVARRANDGLLVPMSEIFGDNLPEGIMADGYGVRLADTGAYAHFDSFKTVPDDAVICILRPFVFNSGDGGDKYQFAVDYFKNIVSFGH